MNIYGLRSFEEKNAHFGVIFETLKSIDFTNARRTRNIEGIVCKSRTEARDSSLWRAKLSRHCKYVGLLTKLIIARVQDEPPAVHKLRK